MVMLNYKLARAFGWTPGEIRKLTMAEAEMYIGLFEKEMNHE